MTKAKKKYRAMKQQERDLKAEPVKRENRKRKYIVEKMRRQYSGFAEKEDLKRGRLL